MATISNKLLKYKKEKIMIKKENYISHLKSKFKKLYFLCNNPDIFEVVEEIIDYNKGNRIYLIQKEEKISR